MRIISSDLRHTGCYKLTRQHLNMSRQVSPAPALTCPGPDRWLVALLPTVGHHHHPVRSSRCETLEGALLTAGLASPSLLQRVVTSVQEELITLKVSLRWRPVEGQTAGAVGLNGQISDGRRTWQETGPGWGGEEQCVLYWFNTNFRLMILCSKELLLEILQLLFLFRKTFFSQHRQNFFSKWWMKWLTLNYFYFVVKI